MIKEGVKANHMRALAADGRKALDASRKRARGPTAPGMRALVQLACNGLNEILKVVETELRDGDARAAIESLIVANRRYAKAFDLPGFSPEGTFDETYALFKRAGCGLGRSRSYARALRDFWDYTQTPGQVDAAVFGELDAVGCGVRPRHADEPLAGDLPRDDGRAQRGTAVSGRTPEPPRPRGIWPLCARLELGEQVRRFAGSLEPHRLDIPMRLGGNRLPTGARVPACAAGDCCGQALRHGRGHLRDVARALGRHRPGRARIRVPRVALEDRPVLAGHRGCPDQFGQAGSRPLHRVGPSNHGTGAGDGLLPALSRPPNHRAGLRIDVRDHRRADS